MDKLLKTKKVIFGLYGAGGFGRGVMPILNIQVKKLMEQYIGTAYELCFIDANSIVNNLNGYKVLSEQEFINYDADLKFFNVAIANSQIREKIVISCINNGFVPFSIKAENSITYDLVEVAEGAIFAANTMQTSNIKIGKFFHQNIYSYVEHDCIIGDYVTFAPNVHCNGNVHIGDFAYIGAGAIIKQGTIDKPLIIGSGAVIGMGAVVTKDVPSNTTVVGNPARVLSKYC